MRRSCQPFGLRSVTSAQQISSNPRPMSLLRIAGRASARAVINVMALPTTNVVVMTKPVKNAPCRFTHNAISGTSRQSNERVPSCPRSKRRR